MEDWFTRIYENCEWGDNKNPLYKGSSGGGSDADTNATYTRSLRSFIEQEKIKSVVDLGCGDWQSSHLIYNGLDVEYTGYDCYKSVVEANRLQFPQSNYAFEHLDVFNDRNKIKDAELYVLKDILQHWTCDEIYTFLDELTSRKFRYIMICNCSGQTSDDQNEPFRSRPLSMRYLPLKKYMPTYWFSYGTKEVSFISKKELRE